MPEPVTEPAAGPRRVNVPGLLTMLALVGGWEVLAVTGFLDFTTLPAPSAVAARAGDLVLGGDLVADLLHTVQVTLLGWLLACTLGVALGLVLGSWRQAWRWSMASLEMLRAVPPITLVPMALLAFGFSVRTELTLVVYASAWPVLVSTLEGVRGVRPELRDVARTLRLSRWTTLWKVVLPAAVPSIFVGLQLGLSLALVLAVVAELVGNPAGLGNGLVLAQLALRPEEMFVYFLTIGLLGIGLNAGLRLVARRIPATTPHGGRRP